jgi:anti-anti-sigma factor
MKLSYRLELNICVISIEGNLTSAHVQEFVDYSGNLLKEHPIDGIIINLEKSGFIDSSGIGMLVKLYKLLQEKKQSLVLCNLNPKFQQILQGVGLMMVLKICKTEDDAITEVIRTQF